MTWVRLDDGAPLHPKLYHAGVAAFGFWAAGICHSNRLLTDGVIPRADLPLVFVGTTIEEAERLAEVLVSAGLWERVDGGWSVHDFHDFQPSRREVLRLRKLRSAAGRQGGVKSAERRKQLASRVVKHAASTLSNPDPSHPDPSRRSSPLPPNGGEPEPSFDEFYDRYPKKIGRDAARRAWTSAVKRARPTEILAGLERQLGELAAREPRFVPHPSTWLNAGRWADEVAPGARPGAFRTDLRGLERFAEREDS